MSEKFVISSAKTAKELGAAYDKAKSAAKSYGFSAITSIKEDSISKAMTDGKKGADFVVEVDTGKVFIVQLFCEVKGTIRSVIGRKEIKTVDDFKSATALAKNQSFKKTALENGWNV
jgi:hypothetical protein